MNYKNIAILAVKLMGLYIIVKAVSMLPGSLNMLTPDLYDAVSRSIGMNMIFSVIWLLVIGACLWHWSVPLANLMVRDCSADSIAGESLSFEAVQVAAVSLLGLFVLTAAVPDLIGLITTWLFPKLNPPYTYDHGNPKAIIPVVKFAELGTRLVIGFWLLLGSRGIIGTIRALREGS